MFLQMPLRALPFPRGFTFQPLTSAIAWLARRLPHPPSRAELEEAYLNEAVSRYDLECREREIDRGRFARF